MIENAAGTVPVGWVVLAVLAGVVACGLVWFFDRAEIAAIEIELEAARERADCLQAERDRAQQELDRVLLPLHFHKDSPLHPEHRMRRGAGRPQRSRFGRRQKRT